MKIVRLKSTAQSGSTLLATVVITAVVGTALVAYLSMVKNQNLATMRSQAWNAGMPVIEAGVEDALTHLTAHGETNLACDGWTKSGSIYHIKRPVGGNYYTVTISNWMAGTPTNSPIVESRGFVTLPVVASAPGPIMANGNTLAGNVHLGRGVRVKARQEYTFTKGLVAEGAINMNGNNIETDSFDSSDSNASSNGMYVVSKRRYNGDIATNSSLTNSVDVGNANIRGKVSYGPKGSAKIGPNGKVGDESYYADGSAKGFQKGSTRDDMNVDFKDVSAPWVGGAFTPNAGSYDGEYYDYVLGSGPYELSSLRLASDEAMIVTGNATLFVTSELDISGQAKIIIAPGATLKLYIGAATARIGGNGVVNEGGFATNLIVYGLPSCQNLSVSGNGSFTGAIYAPQAALALNGGGSSSETDFMGAAIVKSATLNGHFNFHYDEALRTKYPRGYVVTAWNEMTPQEVAASSVDSSANNLTQ